MTIKLTLRKTTSTRAVVGHGLYDSGDLHGNQPAYVRDRNLGIGDHFKQVLDTGSG